MRLPGWRELWIRSWQRALAEFEAVAAPLPILGSMDRALDPTARMERLFGSLPLLVPWDAVAMRPLIQSARVPFGGLDVAAGKLSLSGFGQLDFGNPIDWHRDPLSGTRSPLVPWKRLDNLDSTLTGDKKVVWELNRHQYLLGLARSYIATGDEAHATRICKDVTDWIESNPVGRGINWVSSLELAFRAMSWLWAFAVIRDSRAWAATDKTLYVNSLGDHAGHIARQLSWYSSPNTHLTGEALGLYLIGTVVPELRGAADWRALGRRVLLRELRRQVLPDGVYFERTAWYQRYTLDFYCQFLVLAQRSGDTLPDWAATYTAALAEHLRWLQRPDGSFPLIGDDDGGRLLQVCEEKPANWTASLCNAAVLFRREDLRPAVPGLPEESAWLLGPEAQAVHEQLPTISPPNKSRAFLEGGYFVMRSGWGPDSHYLNFDCGLHGVMNCGHAHSDVLAFELAACGRTMLVDPGTATYSGDSPDRDLFRHSRMHNTLTLDGESSSVSAGPFKWAHVARSELRCWHDHPEFSFVAGAHDGYRRLADPAIHERELFFPLRQYWIMRDRVTGQGSHRGRLHFHAATGVACRPLPEGAGVELVKDGATVDLCVQGLTGVWSVGEGWISPVFGAKVRAADMEFEFPVAGNAEVVTLLLPRSSDRPAPVVRPLDLGGCKGLLLDFGDFSDRILWPGGVAPECEWVWRRQRTHDGIFERLVALHGSRVSVGGFSLEADRPFGYLHVAVDRNVLELKVTGSQSLVVQMPQGTDTLVANGVTCRESAGGRITVELPAASQGKESEVCRVDVRN